MSNLNSPRRTPPKKTFSLAPLYGAMGIVILAIVAVAVAQKDKDARTDATKQPATVDANKNSNPFADIPAGTTVVPSPFDSTVAQDNTPSTNELLSAVVWTDAIKSAERAKKLLQEASAADRLGDRSTYKRKALEAREMFHTALEATAQWEYDISETHGESDSQVRAVRSLRGVWFSQRKKLRLIDLNEL